jgi:hypothetical protein
MTLQFYTTALVRGAKVMQTYEVEYEDNECSVPCHAFFSADVLFSMLTFSTFHGTSRPRVVYLVTRVLHIAHDPCYVRVTNVRVFPAFSVFLTNSIASFLAVSSSSVPASRQPSPLFDLMDSPQLFPPSSGEFPQSPIIIIMSRHGGPHPFQPSVTLIFLVSTAVFRFVWCVSHV